MGKNIILSLDFQKGPFYQFSKDSGLGELQRNDFRNDSNYPGHSDPVAIFLREIPKQFHLRGNPNFNLFTVLTQSPLSLCSNR